MHCNPRFYFVIISLHEYELIIVLTGRSDKYAIMNKMIRFSHDSIHELENKKQNLEVQHDILYWKM